MADYILSEQSALRKRLQQSTANQQASFLGQQRGKRRISDVTKQYTEGFNPMVSAYTQRGLAGPDVQSGIARGGLSKYAESLQQNLGTETLNMQNELNDIAMNEAGQQADLEDYLAQLRLDKQRDVLNSASTIKSLGSY